jgi:hypothetical protein
MPYKQDSNGRWRDERGRFVKTAGDKVLPVRPLHPKQTGVHLMDIVTLLIIILVILAIVYFARRV